MKADDESEEEQELTKSSEKVDPDDGAPESEAVVESNGRKVVEVTKAVAEQDKKGILSAASSLCLFHLENILLYFFFYQLSNFCTSVRFLCTLQRTS